MIIAFMIGIVILKYSQKSPRLSPNLHLLPLNSGVGGGCEIGVRPFIDIRVLVNQVRSVQIRTPSKVVQHLRSLGRIGVLRSLTSLTFVFSKKNEIRSEILRTVQSSALFISTNQC